MRISATSPGSETGPESRPSSETTLTPATVVAAAAAEAWPVAGAGQASSVRSRQEAMRAFSVAVVAREAPDEGKAKDAAVPVLQGMNLQPGEEGA